MYPRQFTHLDGHNAYDVLGIGTWATRADIESARRRLAGQVHPDLPTGDAARMSLVNAAAAILLDDAQRNAYDAYLESVSPVRRSTPRPVDRTPSSTRDQRRDQQRDQHRDQHRDQRPDQPRDARDPQRDSTRDPHRDLNRGLFGDPGAVRDRSTRLGSRPGERSTPLPSPGPIGRRGAHDRSDIDDDRDRRPRPTRSPMVSPTLGPTRTRSRRDDDRTAEAWGSDPREAGRAQRRRPSPGPSRARTGRMGPSIVPPWEDEQYDGPRPALRWQPPPPGPIARWRANRREARLLARGARRRRLKAGSPIPVLGLFVMIVAVCAIGGAALGYRAAGGSSPSPTKSPSPPATAPAHPRPSPTAHHK